MFYLEQSTEQSLPNEPMTDEELGFFIIGWLELRVKRNGRVNTTWGDKTPLGLAKSIKRIVNDSPPTPGNNRA